MSAILRPVEDIEVALTKQGWEHVLANPDDYKLLEEATLDFRKFLNLWWFLDQDTGVVRNLGLELWPAQEEFVAMTAEHAWIFFLKARQLGETTIGCAYDAWVMRLRNGAQNARVHMFSKREKEAQSLLARVKFGLEHLPEWLQLPVERDTLNEYWLNADPDGGGDIRRGFAYPADNDTARGETCVHAHIDEWAFMGNPAKVWQSIEPSAAGTVHFITTGQGPQNHTSTFWRRCLAGDAKDRRGQPIAACFIGALNRPDRSQAWLDGKKAGMDELAFLQEYPMRWEDALSGGGDYVFRASDVDMAGTDFRGLMVAQHGRKYVIAWDVGRHKDAAVGIVLDVTEDVHDVVGYVRLREATYPDIQQAMETLHLGYPGLTAIEKNAAGEAVLENLKLPRHELEGFSTTLPSKARIIAQLKLALQNWLIRWDPVECQQLDSEIRGYQIPDDDVVQDSVMALAIAEEYAAKAHLRTGRVAGIIEV